MERNSPSPLVISLWSPPRSLSTSLMYSFAQRVDTVVVDEPLYAHYLRVTGAARPYRDLVLAAQNPIGEQVLCDIMGPLPEGRNQSVRFVKHMAKHLTPDLPRDVLRQGRHALLIRDPLETLPSFDKVVPATLDETGLPQMVSLFSELRQAGRAPPVVDAADLRQNPEGTLRVLCADLGLPFDSAMLKWEAGPKPMDGVWAPWWYAGVHASTHFASSAGTPRKAFPMDLYPVLEEARTFYTLLKRHAVRPLLPTASTTGAEMRTGEDLHRAVEQASKANDSIDFSRSEDSASQQASESGAPERGISEKRALEKWSNDDATAGPALPDERNRRLLVWVGGSLVTRDEARVSVFDSSVQGGDAAWEGLRVYAGRVMRLEEHLGRLQDSAKALAFVGTPTNDEIKAALAATLAANGMKDGAHVRLTLTRGKKVSSGMSPHFNKYGTTLIVLAEWKAPVYDNSGGIRLVTATTRRNSPQCVDSKIHHCNLINNILAKVESNNACCDDALMLDVDGFVSETNATNVFMVKRGALLTPLAEHCLPGITRATVIELALGVCSLPFVERRISLSEFHAADEIFTTGTMGELTPVTLLDRRVIGTGQVGPVTRRLQEAYAQLTQTEGWKLPF
eukprot:TRINITY_DN8384_c0_g1_i1.p1 TRINITY_DN8384_c0_g1~~TRINITY_DN8384_c0_g1_i1.p1  ORF type:complete len:623 (-),score=77.18 TRINITY_DN8384_c0_g1_i1:194-2062(-)